ncbi:TPA: hypothetical protein KNI71_002551 [Clostridioides difficile]|nr:hypothetical protein [Clostridioides difficile]
MSKQIKVIIQRKALYSKDYSNIVVNNKESGSIAIKNGLVGVMEKIIKEVS